jgi:hypothetical protein
MLLLSMLWKRYPNKTLDSFSEQIWFLTIMANTYFLWHLFNTSDYVIVPEKKTKPKFTCIPLLYIHVNDGFHSEKYPRFLVFFNK